MQKEVDKNIFSKIKIGDDTAILQSRNLPPSLIRLSIQKN